MIYGKIIKRKEASLQAMRINYATNSCKRNSKFSGRLMTRNPRLGKNLISLFRGESFPQRNLQSFVETSAKFFKTTIPEIKKDTLSGQWFTPNPDHATDLMLGLFSKIKEIKGTPKELAKAFYRYKDKVNRRPVKYSVKRLRNLPSTYTWCDYFTTPCYYSKI